MKTFSLVFSCCLMNLLLVAQKTTQTSNINVLETNGAKSITIAFSCENIWPESFDGDVFIIEMHIQTNMPHNVLDALAKIGRYDLEGYKKGDEFIILAPRLSNGITVQGIELKEKITLYIQTPGNFTLEGKTLRRAVADFSYRGEGASMAAPAPLERMKKIKQKIEFVDLDIKCEGPNCDEIVLNEGDILLNGKAVDWEDVSDE